MIAVVTEKYRGVKTLEPEQGPKTAPKRVVTKFPEEERPLLEQMVDERVQFVDNPMFHDRRSANDIESALTPGIEELPDAQARLIPIELFEDTDTPATRFKSLTQEQEVGLFLRLNYSRYKLYRILKQYRKKPLTMKAARELLKWKKRELKLRSQLTQANIPLVLAMAKRTKPMGVDFSELISEGNMALLRSVDKFDCSRGFKFSTYACRAILKSFSRVALKTSRYRSRFPVEFDPDLERGDLIQIKREDTETHCVDQIRDILGDEYGGLTEIERTVLRARFGISEDDEARRASTLEEVGTSIGVTKERVRQIQNKALAKLRDLLEESVLSG